MLGVSLFAATPAVGDIFTAESGEYTLIYEVTSTTASTADGVSYSGEVAVNGMVGGNPAVVSTYDLIIPRDVTNDGCAYKVTEIDNYAFESHNNLTGSLWIGKYVKIIGTRAFRYGNLSGTLTFEEGCELDTIRDVCFYDNDFIGELKLPNSVKFIGDRAFHGNKFSGELILPSELTTLVNGVFWNNRGITGVVKIPSKLKYVPVNCFENCVGITEVDFSEATSITSINDAAFRGCTGLRTITGLSSAVKLNAIGGEVFRNCSNLSGTIAISSYIKTIGFRAFSYCVSLTGIDLSGATSLITIGGRAFAGCFSVVGDLTLPSSLATISYSAFNSCKFGGVLSINGASAKSLQSGAFEDSKFTSINIAEDVYHNLVYATFDSDIFNYEALNASGCMIYLPSQTAIDNTYKAYEVGSTSKDLWSNFDNFAILSDYNSGYTITFLPGDGASGSMANQKIKQGITTNLSSCQFSHPTKIFNGWSDSDGNDYKPNQSITPTGNLTLTAKWSVKTMYVKSGLYQLIYEVNPTGDNTVTVMGMTGGNPTAAASEALIIPNTITSTSDEYKNADGTRATMKVTAIADNAFDSHKNLKGSVSIGENVLSIGSKAFYDCSGLVGTLTFEGYKVKTIGNGAFLNCKFTGALDLPYNLKTIGDYAFYSASNITSISFGENLTYIGECAFRYCGSVVGDLVLPESLLYLDSYAFANNSKITSLTCGDNLIQIKSYTFEACSSLKSIDIGEKVSKIYGYAFNGCTNLSGDLVLPAALLTINDNAFLNCTFNGMLRIQGNEKKSIGYSNFLKSKFNAIYVEGDVYHNIDNTQDPIYLPFNFDDFNDNLYNVYLKDQDLIDIYKADYRQGTAYTTNNWKKFNNFKTHADYENSINVKFDANGGTGSMTPQLVSRGEDFIIKDCGFSMDGMVHYGWTYEGTDYLPNDTISLSPASNVNEVTFTAIWVDKSFTVNHGSYTFIYQLNPTGDNTVTLKGMTSKPTSANPVANLVVPATEAPTSGSFSGETFKVTAVADLAFHEYTYLTGSLTIGKNVKTIGVRAFRKTGFTGSLIFEEGSQLETLSHYSFSAVKFTGAINLPESLVTIGQYAFHSAKFSGPLTIGANVTSIGNYAFQICTSLSSLDLRGATELTVIGSYAFDGCTAIKGDLVIPEKITTISYFAFRNCSFNGQLTLKGSARIVIGDYALYSPTTSFSSIYVEGNVHHQLTTYYGINIDKFNELGGVVYLSGDNWIKTYSGAECYSGTIEKNWWVYFDNYMTHDDYNNAYRITFEAGNANASGSMPMQVMPLNQATSISTSTFSYPRKVNYGWTDNNEVTYAVNEEITPTASGNLTLTAVWMDDEFTVKYDASGNVVTSGEAYELIYSVNPEGDNTVTLEGMMIVQTAALPVTNLYVPATAAPTSGSFGGRTFDVTAIADSAFHEYTYLTGSLTIGKNVKTIGVRAFRKTGFTGSLIFEEGSQLETLSHYSFSAVKFTGAINLPESLVTIGEYAFYSAQFSGGLTIGNNVKTIGNRAFERCNNITSLTLGDDLKSIGSRAFCDCLQLTGNIILPNKLSTVGSEAFKNCSFNGSLTIGVNVSSIGGSAFKDGCNFVSITSNRTIPPTATATSFDYTKYNDLDAIVFVDNASIPSYQAATGWSLFNYYLDKNLPTVTVVYKESDADDAKSYVQTIPFNTAGVAEMPLKETTFTALNKDDILVGWNTSADQSEVSVFNGVSLVDAAILEGLTSGTSITLYPVWRTGKFTVDNLIYEVSSIDNLEVKLIGAVNYSISNLSIPATISVTDEDWNSGSNTTFKVTAVGKSAFLSKTALTGTLTLGENITLVEAYAFYDTSIEGNLIFSDNLTTVNDYAFANCPKLKELEINANFKTFGNSVFDNCYFNTIKSNAVTPPYLSSVIHNFEYADYNTRGRYIFVPKSSIDAYRSYEGGWSKFYNYYNIDNPIYYVTFNNDNLSDVTGTQYQQVVNRGEALILDKTAYKHDDKIMRGWTDQDGNTYDDGATITPTKDTELTAIWKEKYITIPANDGLQLKCEVNSTNKNTLVVLGLADGSTASNDSLIIPGTYTISDGVYVGVEFIITEIADKAFYNVSGFTGNLTIPDVVETIGNYAFVQCGFNNKLQLGAYLSFIKMSAFDGCYFNKIYSRSTTPPEIINSATFEYENYNHLGYTLDVPKVAVTAYEAANVWELFGLVVPDNLNQYTVVYDKNGAQADDSDVTGSMLSQTFPDGYNLYLNDNEYYREEYAFLGWSRDASATVAEFKDEELVSFISDDANNYEDGDEIRLYAVWQVLESFFYDYEGYRFECELDEYVTPTTEPLADRTITIRGIEPLEGADAPANSSVITIPTIAISPSNTEYTVNFDTGRLTDDEIDDKSFELESSKTLAKFIVKDGLTAKFSSEFNVKTLELRCNSNDVSQLDFAAGDLNVSELKVVRTIDNGEYYFLTLPFDIDIKDIVVSDMTTGTFGGDVYGSNWEVLYYDEEARTLNGIGGYGHDWKQVASESTLKAYHGYTIGTNNLSAKFTFTKDFGTATELTEGGKIAVQATETKPDGKPTSIGHRGYNLVGLPAYIASTGNGTSDAKISFEIGGSAASDEDVWYGVPSDVIVTVPIDNGTNYIQTLSGTYRLDPLKGFFVQALRSGNIVYRSSGSSAPSYTRSINAPMAITSQDTPYAIVDLLQNGEQIDQTAATFHEKAKSDYWIGFDMEKWSSFDSRAQVYIVDKGYKLAVNAREERKSDIIYLELYVPAAGEYTLALRNDSYLLENVSTGELATSLAVSATEAGYIQGQYRIVINRVSTDVDADVNDDANGASDVDIYTNGNEVVIDNIEDVERIELYSASGQLINRYTPNSTQITISGLTPAVYILRVDGMSSKVVVK